jgi:hypothetical protein|tara:strand:+ start:3095 stop:3556 length:462 start_codon:yes stop_codon:yes gene_type:complete
MELGNECGTCTACCTSLGFTGILGEQYDSNPEGTKALGIEYEPFTVCNKVCDYGCTIYNMRPNPCREFECAYILHDLPFEYRPDQSSVITEIKDVGIVMTVEKSGVNGISSTEFRDNNRELIKDIIREVSLSTGTRYSSTWLVSKKEQIQVWV